MQIATILWTFCAAIALMLAAACGLVWRIERKDRSSLMLCLLGVATGAAAFIELGMLHSATPEEFGEWLRWYHLPLYAAFIALVFFVHYYLRTTRPWLLWAFLLVRTAVVAVNFSVRPNVNFSNIVSLREVSLFGETVTAVEAAVPRFPWQYVATASMILLLALLADASVQRWRQGGGDTRRRALVVGFGIVVPMLGAILYSQLLVFGVLHTPMSSLPWFLGALMIMAYELGRDVVRGRRERLELAELRAELARTERAGVLGQLAANLAHELAQPIAASIINVEAALQGDNPDLERLRTILGDIGEDNRRAAEIVGGMRRLLKQGTIALQPLRVEDVLEDAVSLVRPEANAKDVVLTTFTQPGLPRVRGDRVHLVQVLLNLLMNAVHAVESQPAGMKKIVVEARAGAKREVEISVRDSGAGIPEDIADKLFTAFFSTKPEGMGVGLALSRTIIEAHGGRLWAERAGQQQGAIFRFTLRGAVGADAEGASEAAGDNRISAPAGARGIP